MQDIITMAHGSGGKATNRLIKEMFFSYFDNHLLKMNRDAASWYMKEGEVAFTTDSYIIEPLFFAGGDIGKLAVCGTINDLAVSGAKPLYISCSLILEEGLEIEVLEQIIQSMAYTAKQIKVEIVTGDTKVVPKGKGDSVFINTAGIGRMLPNINLAPSRMQIGDKVIITGTLGDHEAAILLARGNQKWKGNLASDCAPLSNMLETVCRHFEKAVHMMRDPTRGGVATTLNELVETQMVGMQIEESSLPIRPSVDGICSLLGLDPLYMANEGKAILVVDSTMAEEIVSLLKSFEEGKQAAIIGEIKKETPGKVWIKTKLGSKRLLDVLEGSQLPRIC